MVPSHSSVGPIVFCAKRRKTSWLPPNRFLRTAANTGGRGVAADSARKPRVPGCPCWGLSEPDSGSDVERRLNIIVRKKQRTPFFYCNSHRPMWVSVGTKKLHINEGTGAGVMYREISGGVVPKLTTDRKTRSVWSMCSLEINLYAPDLGWVHTAAGDKGSWCVQWRCMGISVPLVLVELSVWERNVGELRSVLYSGRTIFPIYQATRIRFCALRWVQLSQA